MTDLAAQVECHILDTGYCLTRESMLLQGGSSQLMECHGLVALIRHPEHGWGLWDTGYAPRMEAATANWPFRLYRWATPLHLPPELSVAAQLPRWGLAAADIRWIILSHFHADHLAGLLDFPGAQLITSAAAYQAIRTRHGLAALARGYIPALMPEDFHQRATLIHSFNGPALGALGPTYDVFGDQSLQLVALPGHAAGQIGLLVHTATRDILLAADGAWLSRAIREKRLPHPLTAAIIDDWRTVRTTLDRLHQFAAQFPAVPIIPTHCPEAYAREVQL